MSQANLGRAVTTPKHTSRKDSQQRIRTPLFLQTHIAECGAACLGSVLAYFGLWLPLTELRKRCEVSRDGSSAAGIKRAAQLYGLNCTGRSFSLENLQTAPLPLILFWEFNHFVVLEGMGQDRYYINDPSSGRRTLSSEEFSRSFTGVALEFEPGEQFQPGGTRPSILKQIPLWLEGIAWPLAALALCGLMLTIPAIAIPVLLMVFVDHVLVGNDQWSVALAVSLIAIAAMCYLLTLFKVRWLKRLMARVSIIVGNHCITQVLQFPVEFFHHRFVGDLSARILSIDRLARGLSEQVYELLTDSFMMVVLWVVMLMLSPVLALVVLALAVLNVILTHTIAGIRLDKSLTLRREQGLMVGFGNLMMNQSETLRMTASDDQFFARWSGHQARELSARQSLAEVSQINSSLPVFFTILGQAAVLTLGAHQVVTGNLTLGQLVGVYFLSAMFFSLITRVVKITDLRHILEADIQRLNDILDTSSERKSSKLFEHSEAVTTLDGRLKLTGHVELRNITFGYNSSRPPLIKDFSLTIEPGQRVAIVGLSGSGKSTLAQILAGLYQPWSGEVLFDGYPREKIHGEIISRSISMVDQHISLFSTSVRENITLWNPSVPDEVVINAARDARIHGEILNRPQGYATQVAENGGNFSGGQKQRLEIARALASDPVFLILDEATSALDADNEEHIDRALRRRGLSCLIIAHRLSTIRDCDQIIVLDHGVEVQRGTHEELIEDKENLYYQLVQAN